MITDVQYDLIRKYNVPGPRYTSYPTVPYWDTDQFNVAEWKQHIRQALSDYGNKEGISLYVHLPYCESLCTYCGCNTRITVNHAVELPYIEAVLQEWELYKRVLGNQPKIREIHLGGGTPTFFSPENLYTLMEGILSYSPVFEDAEFSFEAHPANTTEEHLKTLAGLGFSRISIGIQDFDPVVQDIINRRQSIEQVQKLTTVARGTGYTSVNFDLIYGLPRQTMEGITDTMNKVITLKPDRVAFYSYAHVPWIKGSQRMFTESDLPDADKKLQLYQRGYEMLLEAGYKEIGMDHFALPSDSLHKASFTNSLHRNFMGYTTTNTRMLIGLGCSAISDTWTAFAQNAKTVEEYIREVKNGHLPVFRGHLLTEEDLILRKHILNIMCGMHTSWKNEGESYELIKHCCERLKEPLRDNLLYIKDKELYVRESGRPFLRNICMAFDNRLHKKSPAANTFSRTV